LLFGLTDSKEMKEIEETRTIESELMDLLVGVRDVKDLPKTPSKSSTKNGDNLTSYVKDLPKTPVENFPSSKSSTKHAADKTTSSKAISILSDKPSSSRKDKVSVLLLLLLEIISLIS